MEQLEKRTLIVLFGLPGCGKSTVRKSFVRLRPEFQSMDIFDYIKKYLDHEGDTKVPDYTIRAHRKLFSELSSADPGICAIGSGTGVCATEGGKIILELGTGHARWVIGHLKRLSQEWQLFIFICLLPRAEIIARESKRQIRIPMHPRHFAIRIKRNFPQSHITRLENQKLSCYKLDMTKKPDENAQTIETIITNKREANAD